jgi:hypothetical protein
LDRLYLTFPCDSKRACVLIEAMFDLSLAKEFRLFKGNVLFVQFSFFGLVIHGKRVELQHLRDLSRSLLKEGKMRLENAVKMGLTVGTGESLKARMI